MDVQNVLTPVHLSVVVLVFVPHLLVVKANKDP